MASKIDWLLCCNDSICLLIGFVDSYVPYMEEWHSACSLVTICHIILRFFLVRLVFYRSSLFIFTICFCFCLSRSTVVLFDCSDDFCFFSVVCYHPFLQQQHNGGMDYRFRIIHGQDYGQNVTARLYVAMVLGSDGGRTWSDWVPAMVEYEFSTRVVWWDV